MTRSEPNPLPSSGASLGLDLMDRIPELPESVWCRVLDIATDPLTPRIGTELVPAVRGRGPGIRSGLVPLSRRNVCAVHGRATATGWPIDCTSRSWRHWRSADCIG